jgi:hypothetical protein
MSGILQASPRVRSMIEQPNPVAMPSFGSGVDSRSIEQRLARMRKLMSQPVATLRSISDSVSKDSALSARLNAKLVSFKQMTAKVAMHLDSGWRTNLFETLERLLDPDDWDESFKLPSEPSFSTLLRMIIYLHPTRRPGIGLSPSGHILTSWRHGDDRIVIECLPNDEVRWVLSRTIEGDRESAAGKVQIHRIPEVTEPYEPEPLFNNGDKLLA